jgi:hypothetical protein
MSNLPSIRYNFGGGSPLIDNELPLILPGKFVSDGTPLQMLGERSVPSVFSAAIQPPAYGDARIELRAALPPLELPPDLSPSAFGTLMEKPEIADLARGALLRAFAAGPNQDNLQVRVPHVTEAADLLPPAPIEPHRIDTSHWRGEAAKAQANLVDFDVTADSAIEDSEKTLEEMARGLVAHAALHQQATEWLDGAKKNNQNLSETITQQFRVMDEQAKVCDQLFDAALGIEADIAIINSALEGAGAREREINGDIKEALEKSEKLKRQNLVLNDRSRQLIDLKDPVASIVSENDIRSFKLDHVLRKRDDADATTRDKTQALRYVLEHPEAIHSPQMNYARQLVVSAYAQPGGLRDEVIRNMNTADDFRRLREQDGAQNNARINQLLQDQAKLGEALTRHGMEIYHPALDELSNLQQQLAKSIEIARNRQFTMTKLPAQIEAIKQELTDRQRRAALELNGVPHQAMTKASGEIVGTPQAARSQEKDRDGLALVRKLGQIWRLGKGNTVKPQQRKHRII